VKGGKKKTFDEGETPFLQNKKNDIPNISLRGGRKGKEHFAWVKNIPGLDKKGVAGRAGEWKGGGGTETQGERVAQKKKKNERRERRGVGGAWKLTKGDKNIKRGGKGKWKVIRKQQGAERSLQPKQKHGKPIEGNPPGGPRPEGKTNVVEGREGKAYKGRV